jgi:hypothetical protein
MALLFNEIRQGAEGRVQCPLPFSETQVLDVLCFVFPYIYDYPCIVGSSISLLGKILSSVHTLT